MSTIDQQAIRWFTLQAQRTLSAAEHAEFEAWLAEDRRHRGAYVRASVIDNALQQAASQNNVAPGEDRYALRTTPPASVGTPAKRTLLRFAAVAGACVLVGGAGVLAFPSGQTRLATAKGEFRRVALADSSMASINSNTSLTVKVGAHERQLKLDRGEVWLEVAKDKSKPFLVQAGELHARAVGTAFSVRRLPGGAEIRVTEGLVEVWSNADTATRKLVEVGQRAFVRQQSAAVSVASEPAEINRVLAWRQGKLIFSRQTLGEAVADFNRYSQRKLIIVDPGIENTRIVGQYQTNAPEAFARDIGAYLDVPIVFTADNILIGKAGP